MSLQCIETNRDIEYGDILQAATRDDVLTYHALSKEVVAKIPVAQRRAEPCALGDEGVDIHRANSEGPTSVGSYTIANFCLGEFLFSISQEAAERHLPNTSKMLECC
jgi:hypothetical protein